MRMIRVLSMAAGMVGGGILVGCGSKEEPAPEPVPEPVAEAAAPVEVPEPVPVPEPRVEVETEEPVDPGVQATPQTLIRAFFAAASTNGIQEMAKLVMPRVRSSLSDPEWIDLWSGYNITAIGEELVERKTTTGAERTVAVPVVVQERESGEVLEEKLQMSLKEGRWYWDDK